jgi:hypothetical protein
MINTEILAISAIFIGGFYLGYKLKGGVFLLKEYISNRKLE